MTHSRSRWWTYFGYFLLLVSVGALIVLYVSLLSSALANEGGAFLLKLAVVTGLAGVAILLVVVIRDRLRDRQSNRYKDVEA